MPLSTYGHIVQSIWCATEHATQNGQH